MRENIIGCLGTEPETFWYTRGHPLNHAGQGQSYVFKGGKRVRKEFFKNSKAISITKTNNEKLSKLHPVTVC